MLFPHRLKGACSFVRVTGQRRNGVTDMKRYTPKHAGTEKSIVTDYTPKHAR